MISFQILKSGRGIQIYCDDQGMATLISALEETRSTHHIHLRTPSNGGRELAEKNPWGEEAVGEVIITWTGD
jgi:hypothetical protein